MTIGSRGWKIDDGLVNGFGARGLTAKKSYINGGGKPVGPKKERRKRKVFAVVTTLFILLTASFVVLTYKPYHVASNGFVLGEPVPYEKSYNSEIANMANYLGKPNSNEKIWITLAFKWRNELQLDENLKAINDPHSPQYHHFYTWDEFRKLYAPPAGIYNALLDWVKSKGLHIQSTSPMRNSIIIYDTISKIAKAFNTEFGLFRGDGKKYNSIYYANLNPVKLPENIIPYMYGVKGFNNAIKFHAMFDTSSSHQDLLAYNLDGVTINRRYPTGADAEKLYRVFELYNDSATGQPSTKHIFATGLRVATVLWEGSSKSGTQYAPFDPNAVKYYFYKTTPTWIQNALKSKVGYNVSQVGWYGTSGTVPPGSNTDGSVSAENELDLEMVGTLAPGVNVTCVYGPGGKGNAAGSPSESNFPDPEYDYILGTLVRKTDRILVGVSNSWGTYGDGSLGGSSEPDIQALNALGVTVFASSGDDAANKSSIPANVAHNTYGVVAVGGTTPIPNGYDHTGLDDISLMGYNTNTTDPRLDEAVWYDTTSTTSNGNYWGTQCGISSTYPEPDFQNATIGQKGGRVAADISAVGNRTIVYLSNGDGTSDWYLIAGTSVASPTMAGIFAEMAAYVGRQYGYGGDNIRGFGWIDPTLYYLGYDYYHNGKYSSMPPFWDVSRVWPSSYPSDIYPGTGYDMPTGWGVPNAWNLTHDIGFIITTEQGQRTVNAGQSTWYNLKVFYPYGWNTTVGHFKVYGLPSGATASFNVSYVNAQPWLDNTTAISNLNLTIATTTSTPTGTYTIYIVGYTVNQTSGHWGNLTYNISLSLVVNAPVPEFSTPLLLPILILFIGLIAVWRRRRKT